MTNTDPPHERPAYIIIDFTRAAAAAAVVWNHCFNILLQPVRPDGDPIYHLLAITASFGREAVMIFFVISGYWITRSVVSQIWQDRWSWRSYLVNRLSRLWIVLLPALALGLMLDVAGRFLLDVPPYRALGFQGANFTDVGRAISAPIALGNALFLQNLLVPPLGSNGALWTLSKEFWYYIWFPTLVTAFRGRPSWVAIAATVATCWLSGEDTLLFLCWLAGGAVAWWDRRTQALPRRIGTARRWISGAAATAFWLACMALARWHGLNYYAGCLLIAAGYAVLLACVLRFDFGLPRITWSAARYGASASFSLYAYHLPVLVAITALICGNHPLPQSPLGVAVAVLVGLLLLAAGAAFARATERRTDCLRVCMDKALRRAGERIEGRRGTA